MLLSEGFKKRLLELAGVPTGQNIISEADKRNVIINKLKIPKEVADWAHNLSDKYAIWIADSARQLHFKNAESWVSDELGKQSLEELKKVWSFKSLNDATTPIEVKTSNNIQGFLKSIATGYEHILDWLRNRNTLAPEHDQINFKTLTYDEAVKRSEIWHDKLKEIQGGQIKDEDGEVVMNFPDGFYWIKLGRARCEKEAEAMGHCGSGRGMLYSLRKDKYPYITTDVGDDRVVLQMKGRANTKPKADFHKYILPFILGQNPPIEYLKSSYRPETDFNIADLSETDLKQVIKIKPSLFLQDGVIALKNLSPSDIQFLLLNNPGIFKYDNISEKIALSDILKTPEMVDWALMNAPKIFWIKNWGDIKLNQEQLLKILSSQETASGLYLDQMSLDAQTLNWAVKNRPEMFERSVKSLDLLNDSQKDYLVKNYPKAFSYYLTLMEYNDAEYDKRIVKLLGPDRLKALFIKEPGMFSKGRITHIVFGAFLTPELLLNYIKGHNKADDPLEILSSVPRLGKLSPYIDFPLGMFLLQHYPMEFWGADLMSKLNENGWESAGRYIVDHHFDWLGHYITANKKFEIQNWNLTPIQKEKIVRSEVKGDTTILPNYKSEEIEKINFSPAQIQELINSTHVQNDITLDMIKGFKLNIEQAKDLIVDLLANQDDQDKMKTVNEVNALYGEQLVHELYKERPDLVEGLYWAIKFNDIKRLNHHSQSNVTYTPEGAKLRFTGWDDDDLLNLFEEAREGGKDTATIIAKNELDLYSDYNQKFENIDNNFDKLSQVNSAKVKYLITKAFPKEFKPTINNMSESELVNVLNNPEDVSEDFNDSIIDEIKDVFVRAVDDAQRNADETEYWELFTKPITNLFGKSEWVKGNVYRKGKLEETDFLEFFVPHADLLEYIKDAQSYHSSNYEDEVISVDNSYNLATIIQNALGERDDMFELNIPNYGVNGDMNNEDLNDNFIHHLNDNSTLSEILDKAKLTVKRKKK